MPSFNIVVVGAGIAGLSTAIGLARKGHKVTVVERQPGFQSVGGPIHLGPNATRVLFEYGLKDTIEKSMTPDTTGFLFRRYETGAVISSRPGGITSTHIEFPYWGFSRSQLVKTLSDAAEEKGVKIMYNCRITSIDESRPALHFEDGTDMGADLIIGADGVGSMVRGVVLKQAAIDRGRPIFSYNTDVSLDEVNSDPELAELFQTSNLWFGPGQVVVAVKDLSSNTVNINFDKAPGPVAEQSWYTRGDLDGVRKTFANFDHRIDKLLALSDAEAAYPWTFSSLPPLTSWVNDNGRVVLAGDSAHAMLPNASSGGATCIEDSACLAECLDRANSISDLYRVLKVYETIRKPRVKFISQLASRNWEGWHLPDGPYQQGRDKMMSSIVIGVTNDGSWDGTHVDDPPVMGGALVYPYVDGYNIFDHTRRQLDKLL